MQKTSNKNFFAGAAPITLIAGGAGFIGSHLAESLLKKKLKVICVDNWQTGLRQNIKHIEGNENFFLLSQDIEEPLPKSIKRVDYIVDVAGVEAYLNGEDVSIETLETNSTGVKSLLEAAGHYGAKFLLVSTVDIYLTRIGRDITSYFGTGRSEEGAFSHTEAKRFAETLTSEYAQKQNIDARIVRISDVYGPRMMLSSGGPIAKIVKYASYSQQVVVSNRDIIYPVFIDDVVLGIEKALFSGGTKGKIITLAGPLTNMASFIQVLRTVKPDTEINLADTPALVREESLPVDLLKTGAEIISWQEKTTLQGGLATTLKYFEAQQRSIPEKQPRFWDKAQPRVSKKIGFKVGIMVSIVAVFCWIFLLPFVQLGIGLLDLQLAKSYFFKSNYKETNAWSERSQFWFMAAQNGFSRFFLLPGLKNEAANLTQKTKSFSRLAKITSQAGEVLVLSQDLSAGVFSGESYSLKEITEKLEPELKGIEQNLAFLETETDKNFDPVADTVRELGWGESFGLNQSFGLKQLRRSILGISELLPHLPEMLGVEGRRNWAILFQDDSELRPSGGFVFAVGIISFEKGAIASLDIYDVDFLDNKLKGEIMAPGQIAKYLGEQRWLLKDSGWSPNFPTAASRAAWFINKELGINIDGVLAMDTRLIEELSRIIGGPKPSLNDTQEATQFVETLISTIVGSPRDYLAPATRAVLAGFTTKHASLWVETLPVAKIINDIEWDGSIKKLICTDPCVADYIYPVEANLGVNKANSYLKRGYSLDVLIDKDVVTHKLLVSYENNSQSGVWPGGEYKNYIRFLVPSAAQDFSAVLISPDTGEQEELVLDKETVLGGSSLEKISFGGLITIPASQKRQLLIAWDLPSASLDHGQYILLWQKQLGLSEDTAWVKVALSEDLKETSRIQGSLTDDGYVSYNTNLDSDLFINLIWQQK